MLQLLVSLIVTARGDGGNGMGPGAPSQSMKPIEVGHPEGGGYIDWFRAILGRTILRSRLESIHWVVPVVRWVWACFHEAGLLD